MERLRSKKGQQKSFAETSKAVRMSMLDKRYALDAVEKANLQKSLDAMQYSIKVTTRQSLVERLESLSRQLCLKFMDDNNLFIASEMFYLEILLSSTGTVRDVKVHHESILELKSCPELADCLRRNDFADFTIQLQALASIYRLNADKDVKNKAYVVLQALETDLQNLYALQQLYVDPLMMVMQSPLGILTGRHGGHPMRLTYFVPPYELLDMDQKTLNTIDTGMMMRHKEPLGVGVTVHLEASSPHVLQKAPTMVVGNNIGGYASPVYRPKNEENSLIMPAQYALRFPSEMPIGTQTLNDIQKITDIQFEETLRSTAKPMLGLIAQHASGGTMMNSSKGMFVTLPDQQHCYFLSENPNMMVSLLKYYQSHGYWLYLATICHCLSKMRHFNNTFMYLQGVEVLSIPFTEPSHVPKILRILRQQALFNTLVSSCIRANTNNAGKETDKREIDYEKLLTTIK